MKQRLQKLISAAGLASRRQAEKWIDQGRVTVDGRVASLGESADPEVSRIEVDGKPLVFAEKKYYILLNKPVGYVTTRRDPQGRPVVTDLVRAIPARLYPVGRLDLTTEGLLILTNDGALANFLAHPRHQVDKSYLARVRGVLSEAERRRLEQGVALEDGLTAPARVDKVRVAGNHTWFEITIREGRNRQVRRMCEAVGHSVSRLKRIRIGFLELGDLAPGSFRQLTPAEVARLKKG
ncbi:MAG: pseudouridine synthase [Desulfuromonadales bacterium]|jgi:23S rRNA pseudouridine2605 synthase